RRASVAALSEGCVQPIFRGKLKSAVGILLAAGVAGWGVGLLAQPSLAAQSPAVLQPDDPRARTPEPNPPAPKDADRLDRLLETMLKKNKNDAQIIEALFLATLSRFPTEPEKKTIETQFACAKDRQTNFDNLLFVLTNSNEFPDNVAALVKRDQTGRAKKILLEQKTPADKP